MAYPEKYLNELFSDDIISQHSETQSEVSSNHSDWSDLQLLANQLGIPNASDLYVERFKIDRQQLSSMLQENDESTGSTLAEQFFNKVMQDTNTHISWPCRLKIGAKTKKDPHVRIWGIEKDVLVAKEAILKKLDTRGNRVVLKMDIAYTDHSFIIGRGGNSIKHIMGKTRTHVHFPDSNRSNPVEKSNQVSICGSIEGAEKARAMVRKCTPLLFSFEMPIFTASEKVPDNESQFIIETEKIYGVQVIFSSRQKLHSSIVLVKGSEQDFEMVKTATHRLIKFICGSLAEQTQVQMQLDISTQHHQIVLGRGSSNLVEIMKCTGTKILFPDANDINIKPLKRSQVTIIGSIDGVYLARQKLIGSLPVALIFDYPEHNIDSDTINRIMYTYDVFITIRQKSRQSTVCVVVKGIEKYITNVYEARHQLLKLNGPSLIANIPSTYFISDEKFKNHSNSNNSLLPNKSFLSEKTTLPISTWSSPPPQNNVDVGLTKFLQEHLPFSPNNHSSMPDISHSISNSNNLTTKNNAVSPRMCDLQSSGYHSMNCSFLSLGTRSADSENESSPNILWKKRRSIDVPCSDINKIHGSSIRPDSKIISAYNAIQTSPNGEIRIPRSGWQGLGLSRTSPVPLTQSTLPLDMNLNGQANNTTPSMTEASNSGSFSNQHILQYNNVASILSSIGLEHHIPNFVNNEVDISVFFTLSDEDLIKLGIKALGARRRILMAICEMSFKNKQDSFSKNTAAFSGSVAPGAERRGSTSNI